MRLASVLTLIGLGAALASGCGGTTDEAHGTPSGADGGGAGTASPGAAGEESSDGGAAGDGASGSGGTEPAAGGSGGTGGMLQTGGTSTGVGGGLDAVCVPGEVRTCMATCGAGTWTCDASGTGFSVCTCPDGPDPLVAEDFGDAGMAVTQEELTAWRNAECSGWSVEPEPLVDACAFEIPFAPDDLPIDTDEINMVLWPGGANPIRILRNEAPDCQQGWFVVEASQNQVVLCTQTCSLYHSDPQARIELLFGCPSAYVIPE
jgi:hypothetical protein